MIRQRQGQGEPDRGKMEDVEQERQNWLERAISSLLSREQGAEPLATPDEMIDEAAQRAFKISTALGLVPGPIGMAIILPEVAALTKLQINLIYRIATYHKKLERVNKEIVLLILGNAMGLAAGEALVRKAGARLVAKSVDTRVIRGLARKIGTHVIDTTAERAIGRWIPMITAPLFGYFSRSLTRKIGREANRFFSGQMGPRNSPHESGPFGAAPSEEVETVRPRS